MTAAKNAAARPTLVRKVTPKETAKRDEALDKGIAFTDLDGTRREVRIRDVKGKHDAALIATVGLDFMGLLEALSVRQGLDLLGAVVWFGRLVTGGPDMSYDDVIGELGYDDIDDMDFDEPQAATGPKASGKNSSKNSPA